VHDFTDEEKAIIHRACTENAQKCNATGVVGRVSASRETPKPKKGKIQMM
jgi:hypothetical protein